MSNLILETQADFLIFIIVVMYYYYVNFSANCNIMTLRHLKKVFSIAYFDLSLS